MDARQIFLDRHTSVHARAMNADGWWKEEDTVWADLADGQHRCRPTPEHNSLALVLWHMARCEDVAVNTVLRGTEEVLDHGTWWNPLGITSRHIGTGATSAEVDAISQVIDLAALRAYRAAVGRETQAWVANLDFNMLNHLITHAEAERAIAKGDFGEHGAWVGPFWGKLTWTHAAFLFWLAIEHNWYHIGEIWVIRGLLKHPGN